MSCSRFYVGSGDTVIGSNEYYYFFKELTSRKKGQNIGQMS